METETEIECLRGLSNLNLLSKEGIEHLDELIKKEENNMEEIQLELGEDRVDKNSILYIISFINKGNNIIKITRGKNNE